jgi:hypothetical protein
MFNKMGGWWRLWVLFTAIWVPVMAVEETFWITEQDSVVGYILAVIGFPLAFVAIAQAYLWVKRGFQLRNTP